MRFKSNHHGAAFNLKGEPGFLGKSLGDRVLITAFDENSPNPWT